LNRKNRGRKTGVENLGDRLHVCKKIKLKNLNSLTHKQPTKEGAAQKGLHLNTGKTRRRKRKFKPEKS